MARYRKIDPRVWNDRKFSSLNNNAKLLFLYLLTCPNMTVLGAVPLRMEAVAAELTLSPEEIAEAFGAIEAEGMAKYDPRGLFWVRNFLKYNSPDNPNQVRCWEDALDLLPECPLLEDVIRSAYATCRRRGQSFVDALSDRFVGASPTPNSCDYGSDNRYWNCSGDGSVNGYGNGCRNQKQEQEQEQEQEIKGGGAQATPSSPDKPAPTPPAEISTFEVKDEEQAHSADQHLPKKQAKRGKRLDVMTLPDDWRRYCEQEAPELDPDKLFAQFRDYWTGVPGQKGVKLDWAGTWRNEVRRVNGGTDWMRNPCLRAGIALKTRVQQPVRREKTQAERQAEGYW